MQTERLIDSIEETVQAQLSLGGVAGIEEAAGALMAVLRPALQQAALRIAEQAATEVGAQLQGYSVGVVIEEGEPFLRVREDESSAPVAADDLSARITLRLPDRLKEDLEAAAGETGDSVNAFVVKALSSRSGKRSARRITETFET